MARLSLARRAMAGQSAACPDEARRGTAQHGTAKARRDWAWHGMARLGAAWHGQYVEAGGA